MTATKTNLTIEQGTDWSHGWLVTVDGSPIDSTWIARGQIRRRAYYPDPPLHEFTADVNDDGSVVIAVAPEESSAWSFDEARYDVEIVGPGGTPTLRVAEGVVTVDPEVTR